MSKTIANFDVWLNKILEDIVRLRTKKRYNRNMKGKEVKDKRREKEYSYDLRKKVMDFIIKEGKSQRAASRIFKTRM